jgi:ABC-type Mn2+/Zn2+ transport system permease subunit
MKSRTILFRILITVSIVAALVFSFGIINTLVSRKYEIDNPAGCISAVTGNNLCAAIAELKIYAGLSLLAIMILLICRRRIVYGNG